MNVKCSKVHQLDEAVSLYADDVSKDLGPDPFLTHDASFASPSLSFHAHTGEALDGRVSVCRVCVC